MFTGARVGPEHEIVVNDMLPPVAADGAVARPTGRIDPSASTGSARADHRKLYVIDGQRRLDRRRRPRRTTSRHGGFHDVMVRVTGDVVTPGAGEPS